MVRSSGPVVLFDTIPGITPLLAPLVAPPNHGGGGGGDCDETKGDFPSSPALAPNLTIFTLLHTLSLSTLSFSTLTIALAVLIAFNFAGLHTAFQCLYLCTGFWFFFSSGRGRGKSSPYCFETKRRAIPGGEGCTSVEGCETWGGETVELFGFCGSERAITVEESGRRGWR